MNERVTRSTKCSSCGAPIEFIRSEKSGKWIPVNTKNIVGITKDGRYATVQESHFATCPNADKHRKKER